MRRYAIAFRGGAVPVLNSLALYLASQPPGQTVYLLAVVPGVTMLLAGFAIRHAMDVASAKLRGL